EVGFAVDWQIEHSSSGCLVIDGFDARKPAGKSHHGFGGSVAVAIDANEAAERSMMRDKIVGDRADHRCCVLSELKIEQVLKPRDLERAVGVGLVAHAMIRDEADDAAEAVHASE